MKKKAIPEAVLRSFKYFTDRFGGSVAYKGEAADGAVYLWVAPDYLDIGFPEVRVWTGSSVIPLSGFAAVDALASVSKN